MWIFRFIVINIAFVYKVFKIIDNKLQKMLTDWILSAIIEFQSVLLHGLKPQ